VIVALRYTTSGRDCVKPLRLYLHGTCLQTATQRLAAGNRQALGKGILQGPERVRRLISEEHAPQYHLTKGIF